MASFVYTEFDENAYNRMVRKLRDDEDSQREFLESLKTKGKFIEWINNKAKLHAEKTENSVKLELLENELLESEYNDTPYDTEKNIYDKWKHLTPIMAIRRPFWAWLTYQHIRNDIIKPHFLLSFKEQNSDNNIEEKIDNLLSKDKKDEMKQEVIVSLRKLGGIREVRGNRSIYADCRLARAWWRGYMTERVCNDKDIGIRATRKSISILFHSSPTYWERLVDFIVLKNSILGDEKVRNALVAILAILSEGDDDGETVRKIPFLENVLFQLGARIAFQELAVLDSDELSNAIEQVIGLATAE